MKDYVKKIPPAIRVAIDEYVKNGRPPGSFVRAVLSNDLTTAVFTADDAALDALKEILQYCYWDIPALCWGSAAVVDSWLKGSAEQERILLQYLAAGDAEE